MAATVLTNVTAGPGKWELLQSFVQVVEPGSTVAHVTFTLDERKRKLRSGRITGFREGERNDGYVQIEGYLFNGVSPYKHHGTPFTGTYNPTTRSGCLEIGPK